MKVPKIIDIKILNPNKVVGFTFDNKRKVKTICSENDIFSLEYACFLAYSKLIFGSILTFEGVLRMVELLQYSKDCIKLVKTNKTKKSNKKLYY